MQKLIIIIVLAFTGAISAQTNFEKGMQKAFELWKAEKLTETENLFERIAAAEPDQWLPHYYIAQLNSLKSWAEKDETILKTNLDKAQSHIDLAKAISPENPEIMVMQAQILTNWVAFDGAKYGMKYGMKVAQIYLQALAIAPNNPRVVFNKADWDMGSARYFGQDTKPFCKAIEESIELFATFKPESDLHPSWGKERAEQVLKQCKQ